MKREQSECAPLRDEVARVIVLRGSIDRKIAEIAAAESTTPEIKAAEIISEWCGER